jgi:hypothetical protein
MNSYLSISTFFSSRGKKKREISHHLVPFFDIPISIEAPTRAIYIYIQTHTHVLVDMFVLSFTYSLTRFSPYMFLLVLQATTDCCMSVKAKLVPTNRNIACDICMYVDRPYVWWLTLFWIMRKKERINLTDYCLILQEMCGLIIFCIPLSLSHIQISETVCLCSSSSLIYCVSRERGSIFCLSLSVPSPFIYHLCAYIYIYVELLKQVIDNVVEQR